MTELDPAHVLIYKEAMKLVSNIVITGEPPRDNVLNACVQIAFDVFAIVEDESARRTPTGHRKQ